MNAIAPIDTPSGRIERPGVYAIEHEIYHLDPCIVPSLSCSIAKLLVRRTPKHAWQAHARFGARGIEPTRVMDDGSTMHAMMLGQMDLIVPVQAVYGPKTTRKDLIGKPVRDYTTAAAKEERDEIRAIGRIPVLQHRIPELVRCKTAAIEQLSHAEDGPGFFDAGQNEVCVVSVEGDIMLRSLVDRLPADPNGAPYDLKCTEMSAAPGGWDRRLQYEYAFQDAFYRRVIKGARGGEPAPMRFIVIELEEPHGTVINAAAASLRALAEAEVERAVRIWRECMHSGVWPLYSPKTCWIEASPWQISREEDAAAAEVEGQPTTWATLLRALVA